MFVPTADESTIYSVRDLTWRGLSFDVHYSVRFPADGGTLDVRVEENGRWQSSTGGQHSGLRAAAFSVRNAEEEVHVRVSVCKSDCV